MQIDRKGLAISCHASQLQTPLFARQSAKKNGPGASGDSASPARSWERPVMPSTMWWCCNPPCHTFFTNSCQSLLGLCWANLVEHSQQWRSKSLLFGPNPLTFCRLDKSKAKLSLWWDSQVLVLLYRSRSFFNQT